MVAHNVTRHLEYTPDNATWLDDSYGLNKLRERELQEKRNRVQSFLEKHNLDGVWLVQATNVTWYSGWKVASHTQQLSFTPLSLLLTRDHAYCITSTSQITIKASAADLSLETLIYDHANPSALWKLLERVTSGLQIGCDTANPLFRTVESEVNTMRMGLTPTEQHRYRMLCQGCATVLEEVARAIVPGQTEKDVAAEIASRCYAAGIKPTVLLVSADSGLRHTRHPSPGERVIQRFVILVLEGTRGGLRTGLTRTVAVDQISPILEQKYHAVTRLHALTADLVHPGIEFGDALRGGLSLYQSSDYPSEWHARLHGLVQGYEPSPLSGQKLQSYQAFTLIAGINGIQSRETLLLLPDRCSVLTANANWPVLEFETINGTTYRPDILRL